jgi:cation:H+ antiporter
VELVWIFAMVAGLVVAVVASRAAVSRATTLAADSRIPPFVIGITLLAIGTDLPEIANSIVSSIADHGDLNVGDSVGSAATQVTLILGLLPFIVGPFIVGARRVVGIGAVTVAALLLGAWLLSDGYLGRPDAVVLLVAWLVGSIIVWRGLPPGSEPAIRVDYGRKGRNIAEALLALALVAGGAVAALWGFVNLAETFDIPEYILAFFAASLGTSLPELIVNVTALRAGARDMAIGGVLGASFVDSTLSIAAGPLIAPTVISADLAVLGSLLAAGAVAFAVLILSRQERHTRVTGGLLLAVYAAFFFVLLLT